MYSLTAMMVADISEAEREKWNERLEKTVSALGGKVEKSTEMGRKQLAYRVHNMTEALFRNWRLELPRTGVIQLGKKLNVDKEILRYLLVAAEESTPVKKRIIKKKSK